MKTEYEVVFTEINKDSIIEKIKELGGICKKQNTLTKRIIFDTPNGINTYLRVRDEGDKVTTTYKEIGEGKLDINSVKELETDVGNFNEIVGIYRKMGLVEKSYQEMYREIWEVNGEIEIMIDLWPGLKPYIEIEGENEEDVRKYSNILGFNYSDGVFGSSFQIYEKELGISFDEINSYKEITFDNPPTKK